jgi:plastocyanin
MPCVKSIFVASVIAAVSLVAQGAGGVRATAPSMSYTPASVTVSAGATVVVHVMQHADAGSAGAPR